jgi:WXG100 family type VII secretion target
MTNIRVSYSDLEQAAGQLAQGRDEITAKLRVMESQIGSLVSTGFVTDRTSVRLNQAFTEYTAGASTVVEKLSEIQAFLTHTASAIRDMDAQIAARIV